MKWDSTQPPEMQEYTYVSLTCFAPGSFMLGGRALNRSDIFQFGLDLLEGCWHLYNVSPTGISPEGLNPLQMPPPIPSESLY